MSLKERIVQEALRQFSVKGFVATSTTDIIRGVGASKGGLYNHFRTKEELFLEVLSHARKIWREKNLHGIDTVERPLNKIIHLLENYRDRYLLQCGEIPGGCIFINLSVELSGQYPYLAEQVGEGLERLQGMLVRWLELEQHAGTLKEGICTDEAARVLFSGLLGACIMYTANKSQENLYGCIGALCSYARSLSR